MSKTQMEKEKRRKQKAKIAVQHVDVISDVFWERNPHILAAKGGRVLKE